MYKRQEYILQPAAAETIDGIMVRSHIAGKPHEADVIATEFFYATEMCIRDSHERSGVPIPSPHWNPERDWALVKRVPKVNDRVNNNVLLFICSYF